MESLIPVLPVLFALVLWWFITGLIMAVYRSPLRTMRLAFVGATGIMIVALYILFITSQQATPANIYGAVACGIIIWGWLVASYYFGIVTGPRAVVARLEQGGYNFSTRTGAAPAATHSWWQMLRSQRFRLALQASLYHELLVLSVALLLITITWSQPNRWGLWIFLALWLMHTSAKLNVFFGVRNFQVDFLPNHLHFLQKLLVKRSNNAFFPVSICVATSVTLALIYQAIEPGASTAQMTGSLLVATMLLLGIIEHWLLILPLPVTLLGWGLRPLPSEELATGEVAQLDVIEDDVAEQRTDNTSRSLDLPLLVLRRWESHRA